MSDSFIQHPIYTNFQISLQEEWVHVAVPDYETLYQVSTWGRVKSTERFVRGGRGKKQLVPEHIMNIVGNAIRGNRPGVYFNKKGKQKFFKVQILVLEAFIGPKPENTECCHYNDDKYNNRLENLYWGTRSQNMKDATRNGRKLGFAKTGAPEQRGELNQISKLTNWAVKSIRKRLRSGKSTIQQLSTRFGTSRESIREAAIGITWTHITDPEPLTEQEMNKIRDRSYNRMRGESCPNSKLTEENVHEIRSLISQGVKDKQIASKFGITPEAVGNIRRKQTWSWLK